MSCYSCGGNPNTFCRECNYPKDTWIAPVDKLPDTFMGDFDHLFRTPDGNLYALAPERDRWIRVNGEAGNAVSYNDTELKKRITALEGRTDNFVSGIGVSREGGKVKLTYTFIDGTHKEVEFEDKDTKSIAYDDSALKARVSALETKTDKDTVYDDSSLKSRVKALEDKPDRDNQSLTFNGTSRELSISNGNSVTIPSDKQTISKQGNKLILSNGGGEVELPQPNNAVAYDDKPLRDRVTALEGKRDNDNQTLTLNNRTISISGGNSITLPEDRDTVYDDTALKGRVKALEDKPVTKQSLTLSDRTLSLSDGGSVTLPNDKQTISKQGNRLVLSNGGGEVELPTPKDSVPYDDKALRDRISALEARPDRDNQTLTLEGNKLKLANGGEVNLDKFNSPTLRFYEGDINSASAVDGATTNIQLVSIINKDGIKPGDIVQDNINFSSGGGELNYWKVTGVNGSSVSLEYLHSEPKAGYNDNALKKRIDALEKRPTPTNETSPVHRFYDGDIPGVGNPADIHTVKKGKFRNPNGIKVGDTLEDYWANNNIITRGIWKVLEVNGDDVKVQGIGGYSTNLSKNLSFNSNTRVLSIDGGNNVTIPSDKQTISKNGNKIVLSNGGGEVDIPTATPYNDADIKRRLGVLEAKPDNDKQTLSISGNTLSISNGNSVNIPQPNLSGYVPVAEYNKVKGALEKLLTDLKGSGAWRQTGSTVFEGSLDPNRHLATGNINLFGGTTDGNAFIRTNNGSTENDLAGGIG